jgi:hypothetical protein
MEIEWSLLNCLNNVLKITLIFQVLMSALENAKDDLDTVNSTGRDLVCDSDSQVLNVSYIQDDMAALNERFNAVRAGLEREKKELDTVITNVEEFQGALNQFESWLPEAMAAVQRFEPISSEPEEIKKQLKEVEVR